MESAFCLYFSKLTPATEVDSFPKKHIRCYNYIYFLPRLTPVQIVQSSLAKTPTRITEVLKYKNSTYFIHLSHC